MNFVEVKPFLFFFYLIVFKSKGFASSSSETKRESYNNRYNRLINIAKCLAKCYENELLPRSEKRTNIISPASCITSRCKSCIELTKKLASRGSSNLTCPTEWMKTPNLPQRFSSKENKNMESLLKSSSEEIEFLGNDAFQLQVSVYCSSTIYNSTVYFSWNFLHLKFHQAQALIPTEEFPLMFIVEKETDGVWESLFLIEHWVFGVDVEVGRSCRIRVTGVGSAGPFPSVTSQVLKGFPIEKRELSAPINIQLRELSINENETRGLITWESGSGINASCYSKVYLMHEDVRDIERTTIEEAFWSEFSGLEFKEEYEIQIIESFFGAEKKANFSFTIPDCRDERITKSTKFCSSLKTELGKIEIENETANSFDIKWNPTLLLERTSPEIEGIPCFEVSIAQEENNLNIVAGDYILSSFKTKILPTREIYFNCCYPIKLGSLHVQRDRVKAVGKIHITFSLSDKYQKLLNLRIYEPAKTTFVPWDFEKERKLALLGWFFVYLFPGIPIAFFIYFFGRWIKERCTRHKQRQEYFQNLDRQCELQTSLTFVPITTNSN